MANVLRDCTCGKGHWEEIADTGLQSSGYSFKKGIVGTAVFGPIGAVAGIGGKKTRTVTYQCSNCGKITTVMYDKKGNYV